MTLIKAVLVLVLCVVGIGFYRGWFVLVSKDAAEGNQVDVHLTVDPDKAKDDAKELEMKARELTGIPAEESPPDTLSNQVEGKQE